jgi:protein-glutamine gamma-glutamyltransferase
MKTPPFLLFAALLFWGWESGWLLAGALMGAALEATRLFRWRLELEDFDFHRIWSLCFLAVLALAGYVFTTNPEGGGLAGILHGASVHNAATASSQTATTVLRWLPLTFFPGIAAQIYNLRPTVPLTAVSPMLRLRRRRGDRAFVGHYVDISYAYFVVVVFASGVHANTGSQTCFWGQCVLILWALWALRSGRFGITAWAGAFAVVIALGFLGQFGINAADRMAQNFNAQWLARLFRSKTDAAQSVTAIGQIGELGLSPRIVIRLEPDKVGRAPDYLREASYRIYNPQGQTWYAGGVRNEFEDVASEPKNETAWVLVAGKTNTSTVNIASYLDGRSKETGEPEGLLPLPTGCGRLENLPLVSLKMNRTGAVLASGFGLVIFDARYGPGATFDSPPDTGTNRLDLTVPPNEIPALKQVISEMKIAGTGDAEKTLAIEHFFADKFTYSSWQGPEKRAAGGTPLTHFLLDSRSGHCEYFATATVLLLRQLGIPARYAVGYAVHEPSGSGYVVRERDAHAWCLAWDGQAKIWKDFDTTPASWIAIEGRRASSFDWISDVKSWIGFQLEKLRWRQANLRQYVFWTLIPVLIVLLFFIIFQRKAKTGPPKKIATAEPAARWPGQDSAFYRLEKKLAARGLPRPPGEPLSEWLERALTEPACAGLRAPVQELLRLHYRCRFDPHGLDENDRLALVQKVELCLQQLPPA